ncbi:MAG: hypothetical protein ACPLPS_09065 [bacterium]
MKRACPMGTPAGDKNQKGGEKGNKQGKPLANNLDEFYYEKVPKLFKEPLSDESSGECRAKRGGVVMRTPRPYGAPLCKRGI